MKLYHGSIYEIEIPQLSRGRKFTDFGKGFYTTTNLRQAKDWAKAKRGREKGIKAIVSVYETDDDLSDLSSLSK